MLPLRQIPPVTRLSATLPRSGHERISKPRRRRIRRSVVGVLVALSCLLVLLSTTEVWAHRTLLNTGAFVGTVAPVFKNPAVTSAVAVRATDQLFTELNLQARLKDALPPKASFAAVPVANATKGFVAGQLAKRDGVPPVPGHLDRNADLYAPAAGGGVARPAYGGCFHLRRLHRPQHRPPHQPGPGEGVGPGLRLDRQARDPARHHQRRPAPAGGEQAVQGPGGHPAERLRPDHPGQVERPGRGPARGEGLRPAHPGPALGHDRPDRPEPVAVGESPQNRAPAGGGRVPADDRGEARYAPRAKHAGQRCSQPAGRSDRSR